jgi:5-formyltetrahydrofolate cyclo-ligase
MLITESKAELRCAGKSARQNLKREERNAASETICAAAINSTLFEQANLIACYLASDDEVNCRRLIERAWRMKKRIFLPVLQKHSELKFVEFLSDSKTRTNKYGLEEPVGDNEIDPHILDLVFTPLVAFDLQGNRIGMGGGYYDRTFSFLNEQHNESRPTLVGLAFDCQRVEQIGASTWDIPLFSVFTESYPAV